MPLLRLLRALRRGRQPLRRARPVAPPRLVAAPCASRPPPRRPDREQNRYSIEQLPVRRRQGIRDGSGSTPRVQPPRPNPATAQTTVRPTGRLLSNAGRRAWWLLRGLRPGGARHPELPTDVTIGLWETGGPSFDAMHERHASRWSTGNPSSQSADTSPSRASPARALPGA